MAGVEEKWKLLCVEGVTIPTNTCGICHKSSSTTIGCSFAECQISIVQWDEIRGTEQHAAFASWCTGIK